MFDLMSGFDCLKTFCKYLAKTLSHHFNNISNNLRSSIGIFWTWQFVGATPENYFHYQTKNQ